MVNSKISDNISAKLSCALHGGLSLLSKSIGGVCVRR